MQLTVLSVKQLNSYVKSLLESDIHLSSFYLKGEISNFKAHYQSGHLYFSLKDSDAVIKAVMFRSSAAYLKFRPEDGMSVICRGRVSLYERDGSYQFYVEEMIPDGVGDLTVAFNQIKERLEKNGYFDDAHKKPIPKFPQCVAVITSDTGAAVQDIINITARRWPLCEILLCPVHVQGEQAVPDLLDALYRVQRISTVDTVIIGRGGGSIEDLWAFNSEELAYAIYNCTIPVISAVGHETDFTICDFVADLRAPTPSAAAELAVPDSCELAELILNHKRRLKFIMGERVKNSALKPEILYNTKLISVINSAVFENVQRVDSLYDNVSLRCENIFKKSENKFLNLVGRLNALNPLAVLSRGYSVITKDEVAVSAVDLKVGDNIKLTFADGNAECTVNSVNKENINV